jgi:hypothetical protein
LFLSCEESITPYSATPLLVSDIDFSCELMHNLLEIEMTSIEEEFYDTRRYPEMSRVSPIPSAISILHIDDSYIPIPFSETIPIYSPLHTNEVVSVWSFSASIHGSILGSFTEFLECRRHIRNSRLNTMIRKSCSTRIR